MNPEKEKIETVCNLIEKGTGTKKEIVDLLKKIPRRSRLEWPTRCPLVSVVKSGKKTLANELIYGFGFDINSTTQEWNDGNWCSLGAAIHSENLDLARYLLFSKEIDLNAIRNNILKDAIHFSNVKSVQFLLDEVGADVNFKMWIDENRAKQFLPIHLAISRDVDK
jgi:hypothetical protein